MATAEELKAKGGEFLKAKQYDEAIDAYTMAIGMDASNHVLYSNRSAAHLANGDAVAALSDGEKAIEVKPDWPRGYTRKGQALHTLRRYDEAEATYTAGVAACPADAGMKEKLAEIQKIKTDAAAPPPAAANPFGNIMGKLAGHPKFAQWMADPGMMQKINLLQQNPQMGIQMCMSDPQMGEVLEAALGIRLGTPDNMPGMGGAAGGAEPMDTSGPSSSSSSSSAAEPEPPVPPKELSEEEAAAEAIKELRTKGNNHYKAKEFAEALECYNEVFEKDPAQVSVLNNKAGESFRCFRDELCDVTNLHRL